MTEERCRHENWKPRRRVLSTGAVNVYFQCLDCGSSRALKKADYPNVDELEPFDDGLLERLYHARDSRFQVERERYEEEKRQKTLDWWERYNAYLQTAAWRERRAKVLRRAGGTCEACLERPAVQVHHTTYKHLGCEPLFELRAVCLECHEEITTMDREGRGGLAAQ